MSNIARNSSSLIGVNKGRVLLLKRSKNDDVQPNTWCFPGGSVDGGESFEEGLRRECREEIGFDNFKFNFFKSYFIKDKKKYGIRSVYFSGKINSDIILNEEHSEFFYFNIKKDNLDDFKFAFNQKEVLREFIDYYNNLNLIEKFLFFN